MCNLCRDREGDSIGARLGSERPHLFIDVDALGYSSPPRVRLFASSSRLKSSEIQQLVRLCFRLVCMGPLTAVYIGIYTHTHIHNKMHVRPDLPCYILGSTLFPKNRIGEAEYYRRVRALRLSYRLSFLHCTCSKPERGSIHASMSRKRKHSFEIMPVCTKYMDRLVAILREAGLHADDALLVKR